MTTHTIHTCDLCGRDGAGSPLSRVAIHVTGQSTTEPLEIAVGEDVCEACLEVIRQATTPKATASIRVSQGPIYE